MHTATPSAAQAAAHCQPLYRLAQDVVLVPVADGSARLLDLNGQFFALSEVAAQMLRDTLELGSAAAIASVARRWGADDEQVQKDLEQFLAELTRQGLLAVSGQTTRRPRLRTLPARILLSGLIRLTRWLRPTLQGKAAGLLTLSKLSCRWLGWAETVRLWQRLFPRPRQILEGAAADEVRQKIDQAVRQAVAQSALAPACKERGLASWALARYAGLTPQLVVGLTLYPLGAHCWAQLGATCLGDEPERCAAYEAIQTYE